MKRFSYALFCLFLLSTLLTGCGGKKEAADVTFMYWSASPTAEVEIQNWLTEYSQSSTTKIEGMPAPFGGYEQKLVILTGAQRLPDLFMVTKELLIPYKEKGGLMALDDFLEQGGFALPDKELYPGVYGADGQVYAIPVDAETFYVISARANNPEESWNLLKFLSKKIDLF